MAETTLEYGGFSYRRLFPWLHLFRAFRIALDMRKLLLAGVAVLLVSAGEWVCARLPSAPKAGDAAASRFWPWDEPLGYGDPVGTLSRLPTEPLTVLTTAATNWKLVLLPVRTVIEPAVLLFQPGLTWTAAAYAWTRLLWTLLVWSVFGGAITRIAAVQMARDERVGLRSALRFVGERYLSFVGAPLIGLVVAVGIPWLICYVGGLIGRIPYAGPTIGGALWIVALVLGLVMALAVVWLAPGWPLMFAAISAEGSDAFDGISRSFSYVYDRPWHYLWFAAAATVYGSVVIFFVVLVIALSVYLAGWAVGSGMGIERVAALYSASPTNLGGTRGFGASTAAPLPAATVLVAAWLHVVSVLQMAFVYSYFWTVSTIIYFLLRQSDDATDLDEVYLPQADQADELLPLVGVAASDQPVVERPHEQAAAAEASQSDSPEAK